MLHLTKLAVGVRDIAHLRELQAERAVRNPPLRHRTRNFPRRAVEVIDGGSIYWVISGSMLARQRILDVIHDTWDDGSACAGLVLDPQAGAAGRPADQAVPGLALSRGIGRPAGPDRGAARDRRVCAAGGDAARAAGALPAVTGGTG